MFESLISGAVYLPSLGLTLCGFILVQSGGGRAEKMVGGLFEFPHPVWKGGNKREREGNYFIVSGTFQHTCNENTAEL